MLESTANRAPAETSGNGSAAGSGSAQFLWNNQQVIHLMIPGQRVPWATIQSKRTVGVDLSLHGPAGAFATGRVVNIGVKQLVASRDDGVDQVKLRFINPEDLSRGDFAAVLAEHLEAVRSAAAI